MSTTASCGPSMPSLSSGYLSSSSTTGYTANPPAQQHDRFPAAAVVARLPRLRTSSAAAEPAEQSVHIAVVEAPGEGGIGAGSKKLAGAVAGDGVGGRADRGAETDAGDAEFRERADLWRTRADHDVQWRIHALDQG